MFARRADVEQDAAIGGRLPKPVEVLQAKARAQTELNRAVACRDIVAMRSAIAEAHKLGIQPDFVSKAVAVLTEEELLGSMDEAAERGDAKTLELAMRAWQEQGLDEEVLVD